MVQFCCVAGCGNRSNREKKNFYRLPIVPKYCASKAKAELYLRRRKQWLANIDRVDLKDGDSSYSKGYIRICSDHFYGGKPSALIDVDHPDWAPTVKMGKGMLKVKGTKNKWESYGLEAKQKRGKKRITKYQKSGYLQITSRQIDNLEIQRLRELAVQTAVLLQKRAYIPIAERGNKLPEKLPPIVNRVAKKTFMQRKLTGAQEQSQMSNSLKSFFVQHKKVNLKPGTVLRLINNKLEVCSAEENSMISKPAIIHKITLDSTIVNESGENSPGEVSNLGVNDKDLSNLTSHFQLPEENSTTSKDVSEFPDSDKVCEDKDTTCEATNFRSFEESIICSSNDCEDKDTTCETSNNTTNFKSFEESIICSSNDVLKTCDNHNMNDKDKICDLSTQETNFKLFEKNCVSDLETFGIHKVNDKSKICVLNQTSDIKLAENPVSKISDTVIEDDEICNVTKGTTDSTQHVKSVIQFEDSCDYGHGTIQKENDEIKITCEIYNEPLIKIKTEIKDEPLGS